MGSEPGRTAAEVRRALRELRYLLTGLQLGGLADWPGSAERIAHNPAVENPTSGGPISLGASPLEAEDPGVAPAPDGEAIPKEDPGELLSEVRTEMGDCRRCRLHSARKQIVFGDGSPRARLVFVGEGPGFEEDQQGRPFVGRAGKLLDKMIRSIGLEREDTYICNVVKCRPPGNRTPAQDEMEVCSAFLFRQLKIIAPRVVCALGSCASQTLLGKQKSISLLRGKRHLWHGVSLVCTYHPAYLLRNPAQKAAVWEDLLEIRSILDANAP
ncbi:MAG TPA: uracil-DNA glycosylase [Syntrophobacteraceae bacterium]|nr:uracil-DNA glycosylase [Syntrophobacteraceae bacterium]